VSRRGLPETVRMRHDEHYVDALAASASSPIGRLLPIEQLDPNPHQPRQVMGDLSELMASIAEKGIIEPIIARRRGHRYQIVAGERRYQAAVQLGLAEVPVVLRDVDDAEVIEIALIENLQRKDLTPFEESEALHAVTQQSGLTHDQLAKRLGKSRTAITESLALNQMPEEVKNLCRLADITSKSLLLQVVRQSDPQKMIALVERVSRETAPGAASSAPVTRQLLRDAAAKPKAGRPKAYVFQYRAPSKAFSLKLNFRKTQVERAEIITALENILESLRRDEEPALA
jgi:ParB family transcriptional regulator, chromosome partitioning protein